MVGVVGSSPIAPTNILLLPLLAASSCILIVRIATYLTCLQNTRQVRQHLIIEDRSQAGVHLSFPLLALCHLEPFQAELANMETNRTGEERIFLK